MFILGTISTFYLVSNSNKLSDSAVTKVDDINNTNKNHTNTVTETDQLTIKSDGSIENEEQNSSGNNNDVVANTGSRDFDFAPVSQPSKPKKKVRKEPETQLTSKPRTDIAIPKSKLLNTEFVIEKMNPKIVEFNYKLNLHDTIKLNLSSVHQDSKSSAKLAAPLFSSIQLGITSGLALNNQNLTNSSIPNSTYIQFRNKNESQMITTSIGFDIKANMNSLTASTGLSYTNKEQQLPQNGNSTLLTYQIYDSIQYIDIDGNISYLPFNYRDTTIEGNFTNPSYQYMLITNSIRKKR